MQQSRSSNYTAWIGWKWAGSWASKMSWALSWLHASSIKVCHCRQKPGGTSHLARFKHVITEPVAVLSWSGAGGAGGDQRVLMAYQCLSAAQRIPHMFQPITVRWEMPLLPMFLARWYLCSFRTAHGYDEADGTESICSVSSNTSWMNWSVRQKRALNIEMQSPSHQMFEASLKYDLNSSTAKTFRCCTLYESLMRVYDQPFPEFQASNEPVGPRFCERAALQSAHSWPPRAAKEGMGLGKLNRKGRSAWVVAALSPRDEYCTGN